jgi:hypothetical protein
MAFYTTDAELLRDQSIQLIGRKAQYIHVFVALKAKVIINVQKDFIVELLPNMEYPLRTMVYMRTEMFNLASDHLIILYRLT